MIRRSAAFDWQRVILWGMYLFLATCLIAGGASRSDSLGQPIVRLAAVALTCIALIAPVRRDWTALKWPLSFIAVTIVSIAIQLVPLPPAIWTVLPGHEYIANAAMVAGIDQPWRPISIAPMMTLNSLLSLLVPIAVLAAWTAIPADRAASLILVVIVGAISSAVLGLLQIAAQGGDLYFYRITNVGSPVGLFANRNHHALFLACAIPLAAAYIRMTQLRGTRITIPLLAGYFGIVALLISVIMMSGSRGGILFLAISLALALVIHFPTISGWRTAFRSRRAKILAGCAIPILMALTLVAGLGQSGTLERISAGDAAEETRLTRLPQTLSLARDYFPFGSGLGTFDRAYRHIEPDRDLGLQYYNHAHNDFVELIITGGLLPVIVAVLASVWYIAQSLRTYRRRTSKNAAFAGAGSAIVTLVFVASVFDYPLRVPMIMVLLALATCLLGDLRDARRGNNLG